MAKRPGQDSLAKKQIMEVFMRNFFDYPMDTEEIENEFLTPEEVMNLLWIGRNTFYKLVNSGKLPAFRIGKLWRVRREDLATLK